MSGKGYIRGFEIDSAHSVHLYQGSLAEVAADALVSSDDNYLSAGGGVSMSLARQAGEGVRRERGELVARKKPALGDVVSTSAGGLPCRRLYHAITIDLDTHSYMDERALRQLVAGILEKAAADGVQCLGLPALGTGSAHFELGLAARVMMDELLPRLVRSPVRRVVLALMGDEAEQLFYERLVRTEGERLSAQDLRRRTQEPQATQRREVNRPLPSSPGGTVPAPECAGGPNEIIEQIPSLVDEARFSSAGEGRPRLVEGLADLILRHAEVNEIEGELLSLPACRAYKGSVRQRLTEFLYHEEAHLRVALGPALFKVRDLRAMAVELGQEVEAGSTCEQVVNVILRALCFNTLEKPVGLLEYSARLERILADIRESSASPGVDSGALEAARILEKVLKDLLRMYGVFFWGAAYEAELLKRQLLPPDREGQPLARLTAGKAREVLVRLQALAGREPGLRARMVRLGRSSPAFWPKELAVDPAAVGDWPEALQEVLDIRNRMVHGNGGAEPSAGEKAALIATVRQFLLDCRATGAYPDVLRYEGTFENRNGERFVHFLDETDRERKVRTDEHINPRQHYYCFATNNPIHLHPVLIPKL